MYIMMYDFKNENVTHRYWMKKKNEKVYHMKCENPIKFNKNETESWSV